MSLTGSEKLACRVRQADGGLLACNACQTSVQHFGQGGELVAMCSQQACGQRAPALASNSLASPTPRGHQRPPDMGWCATHGSITSWM